MIKIYDDSLPKLLSRRMDLPDTPFWEGDCININSSLDSNVSSPFKPSAQSTYSKYIIVGIDYVNLGMLTIKGTPFSIYRLAPSFSDSWHITLPETRFELVERGNIWRYYHNEELVFKNIWEEAELFDLLGQTDTIYNARRKDGLWTQQEVLDAICEDIGHCMVELLGFWQVGSPTFQLKRFHDEKGLGQRVREATIVLYKNL